MEKSKILFCDDDLLMHDTVRLTLSESYDLHTARSVSEAFRLLSVHCFEAVLLDIQIEAKDDGLLAIPKFLEMDPDLAIIMLSGHSSFDLVRKAMRLGASDYVRKDSIADELIMTLERALDRRKLFVRSQQSQAEVVSELERHIFIGESSCAQTLRKITSRARDSKTNILITGETGTGKEVVARLLRNTLPDGSLAPFFAVDSSTIQSTMAESILFGHEKGAFTGADQMRKGVFEEANGGTVYFDEIANMPLEIQAKLLRVIQEKEVLRLGSSRAIQLEFRVVAATNQHLDELVQMGRFKQDLYQRLCVLPIDVPPLRNRKSDIGLLIEHFKLQSTASERLIFSTSALEILQRYDWPGNVRELANLVAYLGVMSDVDVIEPKDLPAKILKSIRPESWIGAVPETWKFQGNFYERVGSYEREVLEEELKFTEGNISKMATRLGMDRSHLYTKLKCYGLDPDAARNTVRN